MGKRTNKSLKTIIENTIWKSCSDRLQDNMSAEILRALLDHIENNLTGRIDDIKCPEGKAISFYSNSREFLTINIMRVGFRIYIHPAAGILFDPESKFEVEKFRFWEASFQKKSGMFRGMSVWIEDKKYLPGVKEIIDKISLLNNV
jgi:hypothetical protein